MNFSTALRLLQSVGEQRSRAVAQGEHGGEGTGVLDSLLLEEAYAPAPDGVHMESEVARTGAWTPRAVVKK